MFGNAAEWLDAHYVSLVDDVPLPFYAWRLLGGNGWLTRRDPTVVTLDLIGPAPPQAIDCGFRCAKSLLP
jgi:hypothetical protein